MKKSKKVIAIVSLVVSSVAYGLSSYETLGDWRRASYSEKLSLAQAMAERISESGVSASALMACINETAGDGGFDQQLISEIAAGCAVLLQ